jgi:heme/copper-type cytochrome/quinol oxidase subunit 4
MTRGRYLVVFLALVAGTALELGVSQMAIERASKVTALVGLVMVKVALALFFYMHLRVESRALKLTALVPLVLAPGYAVVLMLDAVFRVAVSR